jgi:endonuclease III
VTVSADLQVPEALVREVAARLEKAYGVPRLGNKEDPLDELIFIILSGKTSEPVYEATYEAMKARFPSWDDAARVTSDEIRETIRFGGLAPKKSVAIARILSAVTQRIGCADLSFLRGVDDVAAEAFLCSLPGVGLKTARCILSYSLHRNSFAVDSHISRIVRRLGWSIHHRLTDRVQARIQGLVPPDLRLQLHVTLVIHGRQVCRPHRPRCSECPIANLCPSCSVTHCQPRPSYDHDAVNAPKLARHPPVRD